MDKTGKGKLDVEEKKRIEKKGGDRQKNTFGDSSSDCAINQSDAPEGKEEKEDD